MRKRRNSNFIEEGENILRCMNYDVVAERTVNAMYSMPSLNKSVLV